MELELSSALTTRLLVGIGDTRIASGDLSSYPSISPAKVIIAGVSVTQAVG